MKKTLKPIHAQGGFSLVEMIVAGALMTGMLLAAGVFNFNGDESKATNILSVVKELGSAATRYNVTTGMNPKAPVSLFDRSKNTTSDTFEGAATTNTWKGPYVNGFQAGANGQYPLDAFVEGASATFNKITAALPSGSIAGYQVVVSGLPQEIGVKLASRCNGQNYSAASALPADHSAGAKCMGTVDATSGLATISYAYSIK